jgi:predicted anti-sigma-YlaC factor YlaD
MSCAEIEDLILNESELELVDAHVCVCAECREYLEAARSLDRALAHTPKAPARLGEAVLAAIAPKPSYLLKPSYLPEILDFVGWAAMITVAIGVVRELLATY